MNLHKFEVELPLDMMKALIEMAEEQQLSINATIRQALRTYQLVQKGHSKLVEIEPLQSKTECPYIFSGEELSPEESEPIEINPLLIRELRESTGYPFFTCKGALVLANGDLAQALEILKKC